MNIKIFQYDVGFGEPEKSLNKIKDKLESAKIQKDDVLVLPELWSTGFDLKSLNRLAAVNLEPYLTEISNLAKRHRINIVAGSIANKVDENSKDVYNTAFVVDSSGNLIHSYSKVHLVPMLNEPDYLTEGENQIEIFNLLEVQSGLAICYDLRFPELFRDMSLQGAKVIYLVAEWPIERKKHFLNLLKARAIENQCYVVACNTIGVQNNKTEFAGSSIIIDPLGEVVVQGSHDQEELVEAEINLNLVDKVRSSIPIFKSRRPEIYKYL